jgi:uncharacterized membrane protein YbhN (UPF0104 family)
MPGRAIAIRSSVVFLVTSAVTVGALSVFGFGLAAGVFEGPRKPLLTLLPALVGVLTLGAFLAVPGPLTRIAAKHADGHSRMASTLTSLAAGIQESETVLRRPDWRLLGAVGFWIFDVATLWLAFRALGSAPPFGAIAMGYLIGMLANIIPIPGGIGAVDFGLVGMLAVYGAPLSTAAAAVLIYRTISLWVPTLVGTVAYVLLRGDLHRPISPRRGSWPPPDQALPPGHGANPEPAETAATPSAYDAVPDLPKPFNLATGLLQAQRRDLP